MPSKFVSARLAASIAMFIATALSDPNAPCYFPSGSNALGYYPCDASAYITTCCPPGWTCYSNSLCVVTTQSESFPNLTLGAVKRGACTNPIWNNAACGNICLGGDEPSGDLRACSEDRFCCAEDYDNGTCDCSSSGNAFTVSSGVYQSIVGLPATKVAGTPSYSLASSPAASSTAKSSSTTTATTSSSSNANPTADSSTTNSSQASKTLGLGLGLGLGIPCLLGIAGLIYYFKIILPKRENRTPQLIYQDDELNRTRPVEPPLRNPYDVNGGIPAQAMEEHPFDSRAHSPPVAPAYNPYDSAI